LLAFLLVGLLLGSLLSHDVIHRAVPLGQHLLSLAVLALLLCGWAFCDKAG
jgi:hypothetical protein